MLFLIYLLTCSAPVLSFLFILKQWLVVKFKFYHLYDFCACANKRISSSSRLPPGVTLWCSCYFLIKHFQNQISFHLTLTVKILMSSDLVLWLWRSQCMVIHYLWKQSFKDILCVRSARSHSTANVFSKWYHDVQHPKYRDLNIPLKKWWHEKHFTMNNNFRRGTKSALNLMAID